MLIDKRGSWHSQQASEQHCPHKSAESKDVDAALIKAVEVFPVGPV